MDDPTAPSTILKVPRLGVLLNLTSFLVVLASWFATSGGLLASYGGDLFGTILLYTSLRMDTRMLSFTQWFAPVEAAAFVFIGCTAFELAQQRRWVPGWYDPLDIACYAIGVILSLSLDQHFSPRVRRKNAHRARL